MVKIVIGLYLLLVVSIALISSKKARGSSKNFLLAGRNLGPWMLAGTLAATEIGGGSTVGVAAKAYGSWGLSAGWYVVCCGIGIFLVSFIAPHLRKSMTTTIPELLERKYGTAAHIIATTLSIVALFVATAVQIIATASVISVFTGLDSTTTVTLAGIIITTYTILGGLVSVAATDILHISCITIGMSLTVPFIIHNAGGWSSVVAALPPGQLGFAKVGWKTIIGLIMMYAMTFSTGQEAVQKYFAARDMKTAKKGSFICACIMALYGFVPATIGLVALAKFPGIDPNQAMATAAINLAPPILGGLVLAAVCAATMSSASGNLIAVSTIFTTDVYKRYICKNPTDKGMLLSTKLSMVVVGLVSIILAYTKTPIITLLIFAFTIRSAGPFAGLVIGIFYEKVTKKGGLISIILGSVAALYWQYIGEPHGIMSLVFGSLVSVATLLIVSKIDLMLGGKIAPSFISDENLAEYEEEQKQK